MEPGITANGAQDDSAEDTATQRPESASFTVGDENTAAALLESEFGEEQESKEVPAQRNQDVAQSGVSVADSQPETPPAAAPKTPIKAAAPPTPQSSVKDKPASIPANVGPGELEQAAFAKLGKKAWDPGSLLSEDQLEAISNLGEMVTQRPLPVEEWNVAEEATAEPESNDTESGEAEMKKKGGAVASLYLELAEAEEEVGGMEQELADVHQHYMRLLGILELCDTILGDLSQVEGVLSGLKHQHEAVVSKTSKLHTECEKLLAEKVELEGLAKGIQGRLSQYDQLEELQRQLTLPTFHTGSPAFLPLLSKTDEAIAHLATNPHFADTNSYLNRFRQVQARALAIIKTEVASSLQAATEQVQAQMKAASEGQHLEVSVAYVQYQTVGETIRVMMQAVASRASWSWEYRNLLTECQHIFFQQRLALLSPSVSAKISAAVSSPDLAESMRAGCAALCDLCHREYKLFQRFFPILEGQVPLETLLEPFCTMLIDALRPLYLKTVSVDTLCGLVLILKGEILEDQVELRGASLAAMRPCVATLLHEVQERLTFRATILIRDEIQAYAATKEDVDYPNKLTSSNATAKGGVADGASCWFAVLPRTLSVLSQLYRTVDKKIFEGLAQDAVSACTEALLGASREVERGRGRADGMLFLVMHLLKLREQIVPFDIDFSSTEIGLDFTDARSALSRLVSSRNAILALNADNSLLGLARAPPKVQQTQRNTKKELERELKQSCEALISLFAAQVVDPIASWVHKADGLAHSGAGASFRTHAFASPEKVKELMQTLQGAVAAFSETTLAKMQLYLPNAQTRGVLLTPIKTAITESYARLHAYILAEYSPEEYLAMKVWSPQDLAAALQKAVTAQPVQRANAAGEATLELSGGSFREGKEEVQMVGLRAGEGGAVVQDLQGGGDEVGKAEEERRRREEEERAAEEERRREEERAREEARRAAEEEEERRREAGLREAEEQARREAEERAAEEQRRAEEEERKRQEEEERQRQEEEEKSRKEEEERKIREEEEERRRQEEEERKRKEEEERARREEEQRREEEAAAARAEEERKRLEEEERARAEEEARRRQEEEERRRQEEEERQEREAAEAEAAREAEEAAAQAAAEEEKKKAAGAAKTAEAGGGGGQVFGGGQLPPGFVFENGELKYVGK